MFQSPAYIIKGSQVEDDVKYSNIVNPQAISKITKLVKNVVGIQKIPGTIPSISCSKVLRWKMTIMESHCQTEMTNLGGQTTHFSRKQLAMFLWNSNTKKNQLSRAPPVLPSSLFSLPSLNKLQPVAQIPQTSLASSLSTSFWSEDPPPPRPSWEAHRSHVVLDAHSLVSKANIWLCMLDRFGEERVIQVGDGEADTEWRPFPELGTENP